MTANTTPIYRSLQNAPPRSRRLRLRFQPRVSSNYQSPKLIRVLACRDRQSAVSLETSTRSPDRAHVYAPRAGINMSSHVGRYRDAAGPVSVSVGVVPHNSDCPPIRKERDAAFFARSTGQLTPRRGGRHDLLGGSNFFRIDVNDFSSHVEA